MSPHDERRSCWPRAKYGAGLGRAIWAARRRRHPESLNNRTGSPTEELAGVRIRSGNSVLDEPIGVFGGKRTIRSSATEFAPSDPFSQSFSRRGVAMAAFMSIFRPCSRENLRRGR